MSASDNTSFSQEATETGQHVQLADTVVPLSTVRANPARFTRLFTRAKAEAGHAQCLCTAPALKLVIRVREGRYHLARWPGQGDHHKAGCDFHQVDPGLSGRGHYSDQAICETDEGTAIRLGIPLETRLTTSRPTRAKSRPAVSVGGSRRAVGLLGLLHWMWEEAKLTEWLPSRRRTWRDCHARLLHRVAECTVNGLDLATALYVVPPYRPEDAARNAGAFEAFGTRLGRQGAIARRALILGEIKEIGDTPYGKRIMLRHLRTPLYATTVLVERVRASYRSVFSAAAGDEARRVALCMVERSARGHLTIVDMAAMLTGRASIPVDSSYELRMADQLIAAGRSFIKPLRYEGDEVFPDFVLIDVTPFVYVEVYGVRGRESYDQRKRVKQKYYRTAGISVLEWDVTQPLPDLSGSR
ncbi:DUF1173 family protein [Streptosporangium sp. CA-115845]|uniref:DUF1173 family protein n=1 Tax=Streptosporangium sp. CA-115845 TaxID=3240071 RepID=UPI003D8BEF43